ncbi:MAG: rRNA maturation RNase YbeY [Hyphomonadaceae bacterium]|jgi:probable rRNA maturation factor|nr:rRNA maturation RNase YbeY [Hyphomonadaceae bacterium]
MKERAVEANLEVDILVNSALWRGQEDLLSNALAAAAQKLGKSGSVSLLLGDDASIADLNRQFRNKAGPTNVLSFPPAPGAEPGFLGDIALAAETIVEQAQFQGKRFEHHAAHLVVHGFLHLIGYDHENPADAEVMEAREREILISLGIEDPYA